MGGIGGDGRAAGEVAGDSFSYGEDDVGGEAQPEDLLGRLAAVLAVGVGVAPVVADGDEPVGTARRGERGESGGAGEVWRTAGGGGGSRDAAGEVDEAEAHSRGAVIGFVL